DKSAINLTVSGTKDAIMMVEAGAKEVSESAILEAIFLAHSEIKNICIFIEDIVKEVGKEKRKYEVFTPNKEIETKVIEYGTDKIVKAISTVEKQKRQTKIDAIKEEILEKFLEEYPDNEKDISEVMESIIKHEVRRLIVEDNIRPDNRKPDEIRKINSEVDLFPRTHGSGLFTRGQTQVLTIATLGASSDEQIID